MKRIFIISLLVIIFGTTSIAQNIISKPQERSYGIGGSVGGNLLFGDTQVIDSKVGLNTGIYGIYQISSRINLKLQIGYGKFGLYRSFKDLNTSFIPVELNCMYSLLANSSISPFLHLGIGAMRFKINNSDRYYDGLFIGGGGITIPISSKLSLLVSTDMRYTTGDDFNGVNQGLKDAYISFQSGLTYYLNESPQEYHHNQKLHKTRILAQKEEENQKKLITIRSTVLNLQNEISKRNSEVEELKELVSVRFDRIQKLEMQIVEVNKNIKNNINSQQSINLTNFQVREEYRDALRQFDNKNYQAAINTLQDLSHQYSNHPLISNFIYWMGECYYGLKNYSEALKIFDRIKQYHYSPKKDDSLIMSGISYIKTGDLLKAKEKLEELIQQYPDSEYIGLANKYLKYIKNNVIS